MPCLLPLRLPLLTTLKQTENLEDDSSRNQAGTGLLETSEWQEEEWHWVSVISSWSSRLEQLYMYMLIV